MVMSDHHVKIHGSGRTHVVEVDGHEVQNMAEGLDLAISSGGMPRLTLRLVHRSVDVDTRAMVKLDESTAEALKAMGWTPPEDD